MGKNKYLILFLFALFVFLGINSVFALEVNLPGLGNNPSLGEYWRYLFNFLIGIAGGMAVISFAIGAIQLMVSSDNPEGASEAKDRMKGAILGLILTATSVLIIRTINPQLERGTLTPVKGQAPGVYYAGGRDGSALVPCSQENPDTSEIIREGYSEIKYICRNKNEPAILVWFFPAPGLEAGNENLNGVRVERVECDGSVGLGESGQSLRWDFEREGVYFCLGQCSESGTVCNGYMSNANISSLQYIEYPFNATKSLRIVGDYGAILHQVPNFEKVGGCTKPIVNTKCSPVPNMQVFAATIFKEGLATQSSDARVTFYSSPYGWRSGSRAGFYEVESEDIQVPYIMFNLNPETLGEGGVDKMCFSYEGIDRPEQYYLKCDGSGPCGTEDDCCEGEQCKNGKCSPINKENCAKVACPTFADCPGSIEITGDYLVVIYSGRGEEVETCQVFNKRGLEGGASNLKTESLIAPGDKTISSVYIVPVE